MATARARKAREEVSYFSGQPIKSIPLNMHQVHRMPYYGDDCIIIGFTTWSDKEPHEITVADYLFLCKYYTGRSGFEVMEAEIVWELPEGTKPLPNFRKEYLKLNLTPKPIEE